MSTGVLGGRNHDDVPPKCFPPDVYIRDFNANGNQDNGHQPSPRPPTAAHAGCREDRLYPAAWQEHSDGCGLGRIQVDRLVNVHGGSTKVAN